MYCNQMADLPSLLSGRRSSHGILGLGVGQPHKSGPTGTEGAEGGGWKQFKANRICFVETFSDILGLRC